MKDFIVVPSLCQDEAVLREEPGVEVRLTQVKLHYAGRVLQVVTAVSNLNITIVIIIIFIIKLLLSFTC